MTFPRWLGIGLIAMMTLTAASGQQTVTITKCQDCSNKASKTLQGCMAAGGPNVPACQATYQKRMLHCNKKWCSPKTKKVVVKTGD